MALDGTYTGLQASIAGYLHRADLTSNIPDFVALAEARIARDLRLRNQIDFDTLTTTVGTAGAGLTDLGGMSTTMRGQVNTEADTAITDAALATAEEQKKRKTGSVLSTQLLGTGGGSDGQAKTLLGN